MAGALGDKVEGLLIGSYLGDALGGPIEFQNHAGVHALPNAPKDWQAEERLDRAALSAAAERLQIRSYAPLRPEAEPYGQWARNARAGTVTDDSRHKLVLLDALRSACARGEWPMTQRDLAQTYLEWSGKGASSQSQEQRELCRAWLSEIRYSARWLLGDRDLKRARPPERLWSGLPTCCGQMGLLPLAAIYPGRPADAYLAAYQLAFYDNSWGRDMNAALVAGLAVALSINLGDRPVRDAWDEMLDAMRRTDPLGYGQVPWLERSVERWLNIALAAVEQSDGRPARLFTLLNDRFAETTKWEAQVPFVLAFASLAICQYDPLAAIQLSLEWGHDTDSYAQLLGALVGAMHGSSIFPANMRATVARRLFDDYGAEVGEQVRLLADLRQLAATTTLFEWERDLRSRETVGAK